VRCKFRLLVSISSAVERLRPQFFTDFFPNFVWCTKIRPARRPLFMWQTGSRCPMLEVCRFWFLGGSFAVVVGTFFHDSSQKSKYSSNWSALTLRSGTNEIGNSNFRQLQIPICVWLYSLLSDYVSNSLPAIRELFRAARKCDWLNTYCFWDKPDIRFQGYINANFGPSKVAFDRREFDRTQ